MPSEKAKGIVALAYLELTPRTLEAQKVAIEGVYRLPHAIY